MGKTIGIRLTDKEIEMAEEKMKLTGKNKTELLKSAIYFTGIDEDYVDNLMSNIGVFPSKNDLEGVKGEVQRYVAYRTRKEKL